MGNLVPFTRPTATTDHHPWELAATLSRAGYGSLARGLFVGRQGNRRDLILTPDAYERLRADDDLMAGFVTAAEQHYGPGVTVDVSTVGF